MEAATATTAFFGSRRALSRANFARKYELFFRATEAIRRTNAISAKDCAIREAPSTEFVTNSTTQGRTGATETGAAARSFSALSAIIVPSAKVAAFVAAILTG